MRARRYPVPFALLEPVYIGGSLSVASKRADRLSGGLIVLLLATAAQVGLSVFQQGVVVMSYALGAEAHLDLARTGTLVSATSLGMMAAMVIGGIAIDRIGPRSVLVASALAMLLSSVLLSREHTYAGLLTALTLTGFTIGAMPVAGARTVFHRFAGASRGLAMGIRQTGVPLGAAVAAFTLPLVAMRFGADAPWIPVAVGGAVLNLFLAAVSPARTPEAAGTRRPLRDDLRRLVLPALLGFFLAAGQYGLLTDTVASAPPDLRATAGLLLALAQIGGALGRVGFGHVSDRVHRRPEAIAMAAFLGAAGIAVATHLGAPAPLLLRVGAYLVAGAGAIGWNALLLTWAGERVSDGRSAEAIGLTGTAVFAGSAVFPPVIGLAAAHMGFSAMWYGLAVLLAMVGAVALVAGAGRERVERTARTVRDATLPSGDPRPEEQP